MIDDVSIEVAANFVTSFARFALDKSAPVVRRGLSALWRRYQPMLAADYAAAKSAPLWRKAFAALAIPWGLFGIPAYVLMAGIDGTAPLWATCWLGSIVAGGILSCASWEGWLMGRWTVRQTRKILA